ncbi:hypothetical protein, partial [Chitinimonas sp.]|uniref:hypothetical protein n=1 Tax=Chitinimonas sp. TaxID=1934313 RepID=UPI0035B03606
MTTPSPTLLEGAMLDAYLDQAETLRDDEDFPGDDAQRQAALVELFAPYAVQPASIEALRRLHRLWLGMGRGAEMVSLLRDFGPPLLAKVPENERYSARVSLAFWQIEALQAAGATEAVGPALDHCAALLSEPAAGDQFDDAWRYLGELAGESRAFAMVRRCAEAQQAICLADANREAYRAWDSAVLHARMARAWSDEGQRTQAWAEANLALDQLDHAAPGQDVDLNDYLRLGDVLMQPAPDCYNRLEARILALSPADESLAVRRDTAVRLARLAAWSSYYLGQLELALAHGRRGRFMLSSDNYEDRFSCVMMDWLQEAGRVAEAAELALESVAKERQQSSGHACLLALRQVEAQEDLSRLD